MQCDAMQCFPIKVQVTPLPADSFQVQPGVLKASAAQDHCQELQRAYCHELSAFEASLGLSCQACGP